MHKVEYTNAFSEWNEALPLGNGSFGAMVYLDPSDGLIMTFNHYDVYYKTLPWYSQKEKQAKEPSVHVRKGTDEDYRRRGLEAHADPNHPGHNNYNVIFNPESAVSHGVSRDGYSMGIAGTLSIRLREGFLDHGHFKTSLHIEEARVHFEAQVDPSTNGEVKVEAFTAPDMDVFVAKISQTTPGMIESLELSAPRNRLLPVESHRGAAEEGVFFLENTFYPRDEDREKYPPFRYMIAMKIVGADAELSDAFEPDRLTLRLTQGSGVCTLLATVISGEVEPDLLAGARRTLTEAARKINDLEQTHREHWQRFFSKSKISLPDPLLETLWYLHLYSLASCSGAGSKITFPEACGLNGLWDIKGPTQWGSCWYWDVNIEQAFWPVFTSNHLELAKPFHRGLLSWVEKARLFSRKFHKIDAIAPDFPHGYYMSIWAWCAQYFWWYYTYCLDRVFLRETAYPIFKELLSFYERYVRYDDKTDELYIYPDVAPEQGPLTRNSMSTLSCLKFLLKMGIESNVLLGEDPHDRRTWQTMLEKYPEYVFEESPRFGEYYKDSEWAQGLLFLAHSGILKPIYPIREMTKRSSPEVRTRALGTLRYADGLQAHGTHNIWPAAGAAVLGLGDEAVRMLYDRGISLSMNANGLFYEETDRWRQSCLVSISTVYNPPLIEAGSTIVATINEMLLQSYDGIIEVFPAIPSGTSVHRYQEDFLNPPHLHPAPIEKWQECRFENLLAEGAFEVSAFRTQGRTLEVRIRSLRGGTVTLVNPFDVSESVRILSDGDCVPWNLTDNLIVFTTAPDKSYQIVGREPFPPDLPSKPESPTPLVGKAFTRRRVFLGKDEHTDYYRTLDNALLDYYAGNIPQSRVTAYKFDFTDPALNKNYFNAVDWQWHATGKQGSAFIPVSNEDRYHLNSGRGWADPDGLKYIDRGMPDDLRKDFVTAETPADFIVDLRKGLYQIVLVTGDQNEPVWTHLDVSHGTSWDSGRLRPGRFAAGTVLLNHERDGSVLCRLSSRSCMKWNVCAIIINHLL